MYHPRDFSRVMGLSFQGPRGGFLPSGPRNLVSVISFVKRFLPILLGPRDPGRIFRKELSASEDLGTKLWIRSGGTERRVEHFSRPSKGPTALLPGAPASQGAVFWIHSPPCAT
jgi:hypothetical protein